MQVPEWREKHVGSIAEADQVVPDEDCDSAQGDEGKQL